MSETDPTRALASFAASLRYEDLPPALVASIKDMVLDALGVGLAATTLGPACPEVMDVMQRLGGPADSTILGRRQKVCAPNAAFANGALVHALNYDPIGDEATGHVGVVCLAAPLAMAEAVGGISGQRFIAAIAVACEITARVTTALVRGGRKPSEKFLSGQVLNYFGAAAGAGNLLGLDEARMASALGLALMQSAGSRQVVLSGDPPAKAIYGAFPNQAGVQAALLAQAGVGAEVDLFNDPAGLYAMIYGSGGDRATLTDGLGKEFLMSAVQFKAWPTSGHVTPFIEAAGEIAARGIAADEIAAIVVAVHSHTRPWVEPLAGRRRPENAAAAGNSIPYCTAKVLAHGSLGLADFTAAGLTDAAALALAERLTYRLDDAIAGGRVEVTLKNGSTHAAQVDVPLGHPTRPVGHARLVEKFRDCCSHAATPLASGTIDRLIATVEELERLDDVSRLAELTYA